MEVLSYGLSILGLVSMILASLIKGDKMRFILFLVCMGNVLVATSYLLDGSGINGAATCFLGGAMTLVNYLFSSKGKTIPNWLAAIYIFAIVIVNIIVADGLKISSLGGWNITMSVEITTLGFLVIVAAIVFVLGINQTNGTMYRVFTVINSLLWCIYDILSGTYSALITHTLLLIFTIAGMIIHDRKMIKQ